MRGTVLCLSMAVILLAGCEPEKTSPEHSPLQAAPDTNVAFTPPEIRRNSGVDPDSAAAATVAPAPDSAPATPPAPSPAPAPAPPPTVAAPAQKTVGPAPKPAVSVVEPVVPSPVAASVPEGLVGPSSEGGWTIQVGIHKSEDGARKMVSKLKAQGIPAYVVQAAADAGLSGSYWRVRVGYFQATAEARAYGDQVLKPAGYSFWVDRKSNEAASAGGTP